jgi:hypothetical protein
MYLYYVQAKEVRVDVALFADEAALFTSDINASRTMLKLRRIETEIEGWCLKMEHQDDEGRQDPSNYIFKERDITRMSYPATWTCAWLCTEHEEPWCNVRQKTYVQGPHKTGPRQGLENVHQTVFPLQNGAVRC